MIFDFLKNMFSSQNEEKNSPQGGYNAEEWIYYAKWSFDNAIEYNNEIICVVEKMHENMAEMNDAMAEKNFSHAENVRLQFLEDLENYKKEVQNFGDYEWEKMLFDAAIKYFDEMIGLMNSGYKTLISLRADGKSGTPEEQKQLAENNNLMQELASDFDDVSEKFLSLYDNDGQKIDSSYENEYLTDFQQNAHNNPLVQEKVHGIGLEDYAAAAAFAANGGSEEEICKILGIELPIWHEVNEIWTKKMQEDTTMSIMMAYGQYFSQASNNEKFSSAWNTENISKNPNLSRLETDEEFYYELSGARQAAYDAWMDGAQWILNNYGISLGEFQSVAMKWSNNTENIARMLAYQDIKQKEYAKKFSKENGWNAADDINF